MRSTYVHGSGEAHGAQLPSIIVGYLEGVTVLELVGEHDLTTAENLSFNIREQVVRGCGVVVSLTDTEFIDSSILRALFQGDREMLRNGRRLVLFGGGSDAIQRVFELARVGDHLVYCDSFAEAVAFASQRYNSETEFKAAR